MNGENNIRNAKVMLITAGKGGLGRSAITANLAVCLAAQGHRVLAMDLNCGPRSLDLYLGQESRIIYNATDLCEGVCTMKQALIRDKRLPQLYLLVSSQDPEKEALAPEMIRALLRRLRPRFDYILLDCDPAGRVSLETLAGEADRAVILVSPEYSAIRSSDALSRRLAALGLYDRRLIINQVHTALFGTSCMPELDNITDMMRLPLAGIIPFDINFVASANNGIPLALDEGGYAPDNLRQIADALAR